MKVGLKALLVAAGIVCAGQAAAQVTLFEHDGFQGNHVTANHPIDNFANSNTDARMSAATRSTALTRTADTTTRTITVPVTAKTPITIRVAVTGSTTGASESRLD